MDVDMDCHLDTLDNMSSGAMIQRQIIDGAYETIIPTTLNPSVIEFQVHSHDKLTHQVRNCSTSKDRENLVLV